MGQVVDVKSIVENKKEGIKIKIGELKKKNIIPKLAIISASNDEASKIYIGKKRKLCEELGILEEEYLLEEAVSNDNIISIIEKLNNDKTVDGILVQLPLFKHLDEKLILNKISPDKDVDGFHPLNLGKLLIGQEDLVACTPKGVIMILDELGIDISGKNVVVIGRSVIVGKPIASLLLNRNATVTICHSKTKDLEEYTKRADILVVAVGKPKMITSQMVKEDAIIIDVGINRIDGKVVGDVDTEDVLKVAKYVTPVPGGVGLTTVVSLIDNVINVANRRKN